MTEREQEPTLAEAVALARESVRRSTGFPGGWHIEVRGGAKHARAIEALCAVVERILASQPSE